eukprot:c16527_g1_i1 orf=149-784(-)
MASVFEQPELHGLKYLGFVEVLAEEATKHVANVYAFAKESTGPLKHSIHGVETTVKIIIGPMWEKLEGKPHEILLFVEKKVDNVVGIMDGAFFHHVKESSSHAYDIAQQVPEIVKLVVEELQNGDIVETAKTCYVTYEPIVEEWSYAVWKQLWKLPCALHALRFIGSSTLFCASQFNHAMDNLKDVHVPFAHFIPNIPMEKLERMVKVHDT